MAWIESHQEIAQHPKTRRLARALGITVPQAIGHLHMLWWWAVDYAENGWLGKYTCDDLADAVMWDGDPQKLWDALLEAGWLDRGMEGAEIHDWDFYIGRLMERRRKDAERKRESRSQPVPDPPPSKRRPPDIRETAHVTVPNPTLPNLTEPIETPNGVSASSDKPSVADDRVDEIYERFKARIQPKSRLCPRKKIAGRLKRFSAEDLLAGIDHFAEDWWWMENNSTRGADWFFESDARSEQFLLLAPRKERPGPVPIRGRPEPVWEVAEVESTNDREPVELVCVQCGTPGLALCRPCQQESMRQLQESKRQRAVARVTGKLA
jgi:hypothetical protein